jgi:hypothetical protein
MSAQKRGWVWAKPIIVPLIDAPVHLRLKETKTKDDVAMVEERVIASDDVQRPVRWRLIICITEKGKSIHHQVIDSWRVYTND